MTRVLIYGGRDWDDLLAMTEFLDALHAERQFTVVITGAQASFSGTRIYGADYQAEKWGRERGLQILSFPAYWASEGKASGPIRNSRMLAYGKPDLGVQFPGGRGTQDMRRKLDKAGVLVIEFVGAPNLFGSNPIDTHTPGEIR